MPSTSTINVSTLNGLYTALAQAKGGETILLAAGDYGKLALLAKSGFDITFPSNVTIKSADPGHPAVFSGMDIRGAANLTIDDVTFDYTFAPTDKIYSRPFSVSGSDNITIRNSTFDGDVARGVSAVDDGYGFAIGLSVRGSTGVAIENNEIFNFHRGMTVSESSDLSVNGNDLHSMRMDGMNFSEVQDILIEDNYIHDFRGSPNSGDHSDMIQFWTNGTDAPSTDIIIRGNRLDIGDGSSTQSIFMRNDQVDQGLAGVEMFYRNVTIEENIIVNGHLHGIAVGETAGLIIRNNSVLHADGGAVDGLDASVEIPRISVAATSTGVSITNNATSAIAGWTNQSGWLVRDNAFIQDQDHQAPGYYGDVFISTSLQLQDGVHDFRALEGGMLDRLLAGATETRDSSVTGVSARFLVLDDAENAALRIFDATLSATDIAALPRGTVFDWSFGDGTAARGTVVSHSYGQGGTYAVILTIRLPDGTVSAVDMPVAVNGPDVLKMTIGQGFTAYEAGTEIALGSPAALTSSGLQLGANGVTATIANQHVADLVGAADFDFDMTLKADVKGTTGELFRMHGSFIASVDARGEMVFQAFTTAGDIKITSSGAYLSDTLAHAVSVELEDGVLRVMVDGRVMGQAAMTGELRSYGTNDLVFGNPWGKQNFNGDLLAFGISKDANDFSAVSETVIISNPFQDSVDLPVAIYGPEILSMTPDHGFIAYEAGEEIALVMPNAMTAEGLQLGAKGVTASVGRAHVADILGADDFSIDMTLKADAKGASGEVVRLHSSFLATVDAKGELLFQAFTTNGEVRVSTKGAHLNDTKAYDITVQLADGKLQVLVDGHLAGQAAMTGTLNNEGRHDLVFGNPWGKQNFNGDLRAFEISTDADDFGAVAQTAVLNNPFQPLAPLVAMIGSSASSTTVRDAISSFDMGVKTQAFFETAPQEGPSTTARTAQAHSADITPGDMTLGDRFEFLAHQLSDHILA